MKDLLKDPTFTKLSNCVYKKLYSDMEEIIDEDNSFATGNCQDGDLSESIKILAEYELDKIEELEETISDFEEFVKISKNRIDLFWSKKIPLLFEAYDLDAKDYINEYQKEVKSYIDDCKKEILEQEAVKEPEVSDEPEEPLNEVLYEDEDLKVVVKDGVKNVEYKNKSKVIPDGDPLVDALKKLFSELS